MPHPGEPPKVLTIAGSDSGGAAGLQADLKTFTALRVYGMCAVTAVTAQNSARVEGVEFLPPSFIRSQIEVVLSDYGAEATKSGFIGKVEAVAAIAETLPLWDHGPLVVDPVLVNYRGEAMFGPDLIAATVERLLPLADLLTPNCSEAELLGGKPVETIADMIKAAETLSHLGARAVLVTGHREGRFMADVFFDGAEAQVLRTPRIESANSHGSGDTLSAAVCALLAMGSDLGTAIAGARDFTHRALVGAAAWRLGSGHGPLRHWGD